MHEHVYIYTADCGPPPRPSNAYIIHCGSTIEGSKLTVGCQANQNGNFTVYSVCDRHGKWEPNPADLCASINGNRDSLVTLYLQLE